MINLINFNSLEMYLFEGLLLIETSVLHKQSSLE